MVMVTISGPPGSGTSTLVGKIAQAFGWDSLNGGDVFRTEANRRGLSVEDLSAVAKGDLDVDRALDALLRELMSADNSPEIIESRLSGWWAHQMGIDCLRVWVAVSEEERAHRIQSREGGDFEDCLKRSRQRQKDDMERYLILYDIDLDDLSPYNLVVDADDKDENEVFAIVNAKLGS